MWVEKGCLLESGVFVNGSSSSLKLQNKRNPLSYISTRHKFHIVDPSPWPFVASLGALMTAMGGVLYMHRFAMGWGLLLHGLLLVAYVTYVWFRDIVREATYEGHHTVKVQRGLRLGVILFIVSEAMFFFGFFWAFFHSSLSPSHNIGGVWPPAAISPPVFYFKPLTNTVLLLTSGVSLTWAHRAVALAAKKHAVVALSYTIFLACLFTFFQVLEYKSLTFNISDGIYGSCFYMITGLHGFHVLAGTVALVVSLVRLVLNHFTTTQHIGLESAVWYWHFVDAIWIFVFGSVYWWGSLKSSLIM